MSQFESSQRISLPIWALATLVAIVIHLGCVALAREYMQGDDPDPELGARAIEIGIELLAPRLDPSDLPSGPDVEQSAASPPAVEHTEITEPKVLPREAPTETEDSARVVAPVETKQKEDTPVTPTPANPSPPMTAVEATARPTSETIKDSTRSITPEQGTGESPQRVRATWQKELIAHLDRHKRYPATSSLQSAESLVNFVIDETGRVLSSKDRAGFWRCAI
jgi:periplasmic protein TonB